VEVMGLMMLSCGDGIGNVAKLLVVGTAGH